MLFKRLIPSPLKSNSFLICGQSYKQFTLVNYDSRVVTWTISYSYDSRVVNYDGKVLYKIDHWCVIKPHHQGIII